MRPHPSSPTWPSTPSFLLLSPRPPLPSFSSLGASFSSLPPPPVPTPPSRPPLLLLPQRAPSRRFPLPAPAPCPVPPPPPPPRARCPPPPSSLPAAAPPLPPLLAWALPLATPAPEPGSDAPRRCQPLSPGGRGGSSSTSSSSWSRGAVTAAYPSHSPSPTARLRLASSPGTESGPDPRDRAVSGPPAAAPLLPHLRPAVELRLGGRGAGGVPGGGRGGASCARAEEGDAGKRLRPGRSGLGRAAGECFRVGGSEGCTLGAARRPRGGPSPECRGPPGAPHSRPRAPVLGAGDCVRRAAVLCRGHTVCCELGSASRGGRRSLAPGWGPGSP